MKKWLQFSLDELFKLLVQTKSKVLLVIMACYGIGISVLYFILDQNVGSNMLSSKHFPLFALSLLSGLILPIITLSIGSELIASEIKEGTLKNILALPLSREKIYSGKLMAGFLFIGSALGVLLVTTLVGALFVNGITSILGIITVILGFIGYWIFLGLLLIMANAFAIMTGNPSSGMLINLGIWFGMGALAIVKYDWNRFLPVSYTEWYKPFIFGGPYAPAIPVLLFMISYYIILTIVGIERFQKKEV